MASTATMIIYTCRFTGDEMCSDAFLPYSVTDDVTGDTVPGLFQVDSQKVNKDSGATVGRICLCILTVVST